MDFEEKWILAQLAALEEVCTMNLPALNPAYPEAGLFRNKVTLCLHAGSESTLEKMACGKANTTKMTALSTWPVVCQPLCKDCFKKGFA